MWCKLLYKFLVVFVLKIVEHIESSNELLLAVRRRRNEDNLETADVWKGVPLLERTDEDAHDEEVKDEVKEESDEEEVKEEEEEVKEEVKS